MKIISVARKKAHLQWVREELSRVWAIALANTVSFQFYVTGETGKKGFTEESKETALKHDDVEIKAEQIHLDTSQKTPTLT